MSDKRYVYLSQDAAVIVSTLEARIAELEAQVHQRALQMARDAKRITEFEAALENAGATWLTEKTAAVLAEREVCAQIAGTPETRDEEFMRRRPDDERDADQRDIGRARAAADIRARPAP